MRQSIEHARWARQRALGVGLLALVWLLAALPVAADGIAVGPGDYRQALRALEPGDVVQLSGGVYRDGLPVHGIVGTATRPVQIRGPRSGEPAVFVARPGANTVSIIDSAHVVIADLVLDGQGLDVDGVKAEGHARWAHHITLENLSIRDHSGSQQTVAISTKCPAWDWVIRGNTIVAAGTGMYLGDSDGRAPFIGGLIEYNTVRDTYGYNLQIKHQVARPEQGGLPREPRETIIRHNVFSKARNASTETLARPNVLIGHFPPAGAGSEDRYLIYGNLFFQNPAERLFQGEGTLALYNNVFINRLGDAIAVQPHKGEVRRVWIGHNTVLASGAGILLTTGAGTEEARIDGNAVFAATMRGVPTQRNRTGTAAEATAYLRAPVGRLEDLDLRPSSPRGGVRAPWLERLPDGRCDYRGRARDHDDAGALSAAGRRPRLSLQGKMPVACPPEPRLESTALPKMPP